MSYFNNIDVNINMLSFYGPQKSSDFDASFGTTQESC